METNITNASERSNTAIHIDEGTKIGDIFKNMDEVQIYTTDGRDSDSVSCAGKCDKDKVASFVVPEGYERHNFSAETSHSGQGANANVYWLTNDAHDGRIKLEANSKALGRAVARVKEVTAIRLINQKNH